MIRLLALAMLCTACTSAESRQPAPPATPTVPQGDAVIGATLTADDLHNLVACARLALRDLTPDQMAVVALAIKHAEFDATTQTSRIAPAAPASPPTPDAKK